MSYKVDFKDLDKVERLMNALGNKAVPIAKQMVYVGAGEIADSVRSNLNSVLSDEATGELAQGLDTSQIKANITNVSNNVTFVGYDSKGVPKALIANVLESGRSDQPNRRATHFFSRAVNSGRPKAIIEMAKKFDEVVEKISKSVGD